MKKIVVSLVAMLLMLCAALPCFAETPADVLPVIRMEQQKKEYRTPQGQVCIVTDYTRMTVENADLFPALAKKLEHVHNTEWNYRMTDEARDGYKDAVELKKHRPEDYMYFLLEERVLQKYLDRNILSLYVDYFGKAVSTDKILNDFSVVSRLDVKLKDVNIFAKGGYEQNKAEDFWTPLQKDILMAPGQSYCFYGAGVEYRPAFYKNIRLHAYVANAQTIQETFDPAAPYPAGETIWANSENKSSNVNVNIGLSWNVDFLKFIDKKFKRDNN